MSWIQITLTAFAALVVAPSGVVAQAKRPDFSGTWQVDIEASKVLTEKHGQPWRVSGATGGGGSSSSSTAKVPVTVITQSEAEIVFERRFEGEVLSREVHKLDGSLSINARRNISSRTQTVWKDGTLVTTGSMHFDLSDGRATKADGTVITELNRQIVITRKLGPDGTMQVESRATEDGQERVSWEVHVRVKPS